MRSRKTLLYSLLAGSALSVVAISCADYLTGQVLEPDGPLLVTPGALIAIKGQRLAIADLATPIIDIWDDIITLPIIGVVDTQRLWHVVVHNGDKPRYALITSVESVHMRLRSAVLCATRRSRVWFNRRSASTAMMASKTPEAPRVCPSTPLIEFTGTCAARAAPLIGA